MAFSRLTMLRYLIGQSYVLMFIVSRQAFRTFSFLEALPVVMLVILSTQTAIDLLELEEKKEMQQQVLNQQPLPSAKGTTDPAPPMN